MPKILLLPLLGILLAHGLSAQQKATVWVADFVRIKAGHRAETLFFYENNCKFLKELDRDIWIPSTEA